MSLAELRGRYGDLYVPRFRIELGDDEIVESEGRVSTLEVDTTLDGADRFSATLTESFDHAAGRFDDLDPTLFEAGTPVAIALGYGTRLDPVFSGSVRSVRATFPAEGGPTVEVSGYDITYDMTRDTHSDSWDEQTDSEVVRDVAGNYGVSDLVVEDTGLTRRKVVQDNLNDYRFLKGLAGRNGFELFANRDTLSFRAPKDDREPAASLRYGGVLSSFTAERSDAGQIAEVEVRYWNPSRKAEIVGSATRDVEGTAKKVIRRPVDSQAEAEQVAQATLDRIAAGTVRGHGEAIGFPGLRPGETIRVLGVGEEFSTPADGSGMAPYYVERATHRFGPSGYQTSFEVREGMA